jgi:hypothetical protein
MPVSYDQSQILKCNVSFSFIRYVVKRSGTSVAPVVKNPDAPGIPELSEVNTSIFNQVGDFFINQVNDVTLPAVPSEVFAPPPVA